MWYVRSPPFPKGFPAVPEHRKQRIRRGFRAQAEWALVEANGKTREAVSRLATKLWGGAVSHLGEGPPFRVPGRYLDGSSLGAPFGHLPH